MKLYTTVIECFYVYTLAISPSIFFRNSHSTYHTTKVSPITILYSVFFWSCDHCICSAL